MWSYYEKKYIAQAESILVTAEIDKEYCEIVKNRIKDLNEGKMDYREDKEVPKPKGKVSETPLEWKR